MVTMEKFIWNYQMRGAFIVERTLHVLKEKDGREYKTKCGHSGHGEQHHFGIDKELEIIADRYKCGRCFDL